MKVHIGVDSRHGFTHSASITAANVHDGRKLPNLLPGNETRLYGDSAYIGQKGALKEIAPNVKDITNKRTSRNRPLKSLFGFAKARLCFTGADPYRQMGATADGTGASSVGRVRG